MSEHPLAPNTATVDDVLGVYVHIPFCSSKCRYCDFYSEILQPARVERFIDCLAREWELRLEEHGLQGSCVGSVYVGGGTPSVLTLAQWEGLLRFLESVPRNPGCEWTVEVNPESLTDLLLELLYEAGVNRVSVGVQSLCDRKLGFLGRRHTAIQAMDALVRCGKAGFGSVSADIMYGLPGQDLYQIQQDLRGLLRCDAVKHLSAYELTLSPCSPLGRHRSLLPLPDEDSVVAMYNGIGATLLDAGFEQYEVSNYALPGYYSRHNSAYWNHSPYVGLGPSAHSYLPPLRLANAANTDAYLNHLERGVLPPGEKETVAGETLAREIVMVGMRTIAGVNVKRVETAQGRPFWNDRRRSLCADWERQGLVTVREGTIVPSSAGLLLADGLARMLV